MPTASDVAGRARRYAEAGTYWGVGMCLKFSRTCAGAPGGVYDAITAWRNARHRHSDGTPPRGSMVFWSGGSKGHGHIAVSDGGGYVFSTDIVRSGRVNRVSIAYLSTRWGNLQYLGWSEDVNGAVVTSIIQPTSSITMVRLANLRPGLRNADVTDLQLALRRHGVATFTATGYFGGLTRDAVAAFQRKQGWAGEDANGIPGPRTCALLGLHVI